MSHLGAIIIDDDRKRREELLNILPDYVDAAAVGAADGALEYL